jgi:hypothetical protein
MGGIAYFIIAGIVVVILAIIKTFSQSHKNKTKLFEPLSNPAKYRHDVLIEKANLKKNFKVRTCPDCMGRGKSMRACGFCFGSGFKTCTSCGGSGGRMQSNYSFGKMKTQRVTCGSCGGAGKQRCMSCKGSGKHWLRTDCATCLGVGKI